VRSEHHLARACRSGTLQSAIARVLVARNGRSRRSSTRDPSCNAFTDLGVASNIHASRSRTDMERPVTVE
jgi:hypothetical protein